MSNKRKYTKKVTSNSQAGIIFFYVFTLSLFCFHSLLAQSNLPTNVPDRIIVNPGEDALTSIAVTWRTDTSVKEGYCELQSLTPSRIDNTKSKSIKANTQSFIYKHENEAEVPSHHHSCIIKGLQPGAAYLYRVGNGDTWSEWVEFKMADDLDEISFIYFGDPQNDLKSQWSRIVRKAYSESDDKDFMLYAGDIINRAGSDREWDEWFEAGDFIYRSIPQICTPGNHDYDDNTIDPHWNRQFTQPQNGPEGLKGSCFYVDYKNLKIISLDSAAEGELEDENGKALVNQKKWLEDVLSKNKKEWVILTTHLPFYSPKQSRDNSHLRKHFQPIIEKYGVDMVLSGHDHSYGRGLASDNSDIKPSIVYVVSVSGPKQYDVGDKDWMIRRGEKLLLYQTIDIKGNELSYSAFTANGDLYDKFLLKKNKKGKNKILEQK